ncbi:hypothetical protein NEMBOFW57_001040 [Staphylotrichum longicolle]|uniref:Riboflavin kinase n=1 Tax=Staphylotrichum longicolle TaxID=669026 RepID=A0AAD4I0G3_9PEZI|nr:hypothetical protein NEMBOFW57_001040 [Staphylotrichum longicolle]
MMAAPVPLQIRRKPTATFVSPQPPTLGLYGAVPPTPGWASDAEDEKPPPLPVRPGLRPVSRGAEPLLQVPQGRGLRTQKSMPELSRHTADSPPPSPFDATPVAQAATFGPGVGVGGGKKTFMQTALSEARHFAGGLIPHPTESTKHYTILRHSPPLIFYRGPSTSVAITIFSSLDHPLPPDRTLWLQQRGFSGDSGMKIKAFFNATDSWLHVTPATQVQTHQLNPDDDRAWQRDIDKAARKLLKEKGPKKAHIPRETHVIRIPEASEDGYFRLILCTGKGTPFGPSETSSKCKTLCSSPIFRVASTSTDSSVFRGASLSTIPLEMGVFVASMVATTTVDRYVAPVRDPIEAVVDKVRPGFVAETVGGLVRDELSDRSAERGAERDQAFYAAHQAHVARSLEADPNTIYPIGPDSGPEPPFPIQFQGKVVPGTGRSQAELGIPTANLANVPDETQTQPPNGTKPSSPSPPAPSPGLLHLLNLPASTPPFHGATLKTLVMGLLRPAPTPLAPILPLNERLDAVSRDVCLALVSLEGRANWAPDAGAVARGVERQRSGRGVMERVGEVGGGLVERVLPGGLPSVPVHWVGVRLGEGGERDRVRGVGGFWVAR